MVQSICDIPQASYLRTASSHQKGSEKTCQASRWNPDANLIIDILTLDLGGDKSLWHKLLPFYVPVLTETFFIQLACT